MDLHPEEEGDLTAWTYWIQPAQVSDHDTQQKLRRNPRTYTRRLGLIRNRFPEKDTDKIFIPHSIAWDFARKVHLFLLHFGTDKVVHFIK